MPEVNRTDTIPHGTNHGYARCRRSAGTACGPCKAARAENQQQWRQTNPSAERNARLRTLYGIGAADYDRMLEEQGGACAVCRQAERRTNQHGPLSLSVDHDHATGAVRGLLCTDCNRALGLLGDCPDRITAAASYLRGAR